MNPKNDLKERINKEITSIMEEQEHLGAEKENYRHNENAVKTYVDMLNSLEEGDRKDRELELKFQEEKRLSREFKLKERELKMNSDNRLRADAVEMGKYVIGMYGFKKIFEMIVNYEKEGVITTKTFNPIMGQAFRFLLPK